MSIYKGSNKIMGSLEKVPIASTINESSTNEECAGAKAVYDIKKSIPDIINKNMLICPTDKSVREFALENAQDPNTTLRFVQWLLGEGEVPNDSAGKFAEYIYIVGLDPNWSTLIAIVCNSDGSRIIRCCGYSKYLKVWSNWKTLNSSSVADVPKTTITTFDNDAFSGTIYYKIINGICYLHLYKIKSTESGIAKLVLSNLPKSSVTQVGEVHRDNDGGTVGLAYVNENATTLKMHVYITNAEGHCTFSYPVAEP